MSTLKIIGLVLLLILLMPLGGTVGAQDWCRVADARTDAATRVLNGTDKTPLMAGAFNNCSSSTQSTSRLEFDGVRGDVAGPDSKVAADVAAFLVAGGGFACGPDLACEPATQYCAVVIGGPKGVPPGYGCVAPPEAIFSPTCENIPDIGAGCECQELNGGITVTCTAP